MRIVHYLRRIRLEDGGVVRAVLNLTEALAAAGHEVTLATIDDQDVRAVWPDPSGRPRVVVLEGPGRPAGLLGGAQLGALGDLLGEADVAHFHSMWTTSNMQAAGLARRRGVPYVYSVHGMLDDWCMGQRTLKKRVYLSLAGRRALHGAAFVHCTAQAELEQASKWFPRGRGVVVPLICELGPFENPPGPGRARERFSDVDWSRPTILFLSRIHYKKGPDVLIRAAGILRREGRAFNLLFAGTGEEAYVRQLEQLASREGVDARFVGFVTGDDKISLLQAADVFALPTSQENFGFVFFEALAAGTPIVTTKGTDTWPELVESGGTVLSSGEPGATASAIGSLLDEPGRPAEMGRAGRSWALEHLRPDRVVARFTEMYAEAAEVGA